jgi:ABC-type uncharacterized transport system substrate-binding protein
MPVMRPAGFRLVINMKTAERLGINFAQSLLLCADEVIM